MGDARLKAHLHMSVEAEVFYKEGREQNREMERGAWKVLHMQMSPFHSGKASDGPVCVILV